MSTAKSTFRHGDTMIAVESRPATIAFDDLLAATEVVYDQYESMTPWETLRRIRAHRYPGAPLSGRGRRPRNARQRLLRRAP